MADGSWSKASGLPFAAGAVLATTAVAVYLNTLPNGLVVDDVHQIVQNEWITDPRHLGAIFTRGVWDFEGRESNYYRPLMYVLYMLVYRAAGLAPWAYHLLNVLLHAAVTLLVALVARQVLPRTEARGPAWLAPPFVAALFFAVHPIHTEPVAWAAGINDLGLAAFGLLALWYHATAGDDWRRELAAAACWLMALLCKETAVVIPLLVVAHDLLLVEPARRWTRILRAAAAFAPAAAVYLGLRLNALGGIVPATQATGLTVPGYALAVLTLLGGYIEKLVAPINLNFWHAFTPPASLLSAEALRAAAVVGLAATAVVAFCRTPASRFAVALVLVPLLPSFNLGALNQGLENAFAERYLYLPSAGFVLLLALGVDALRAQASPRNGQVIAAVFLVASTWAAGTLARNTVWKNHLTLWTDAVQKSPGSAVAHMNYGAALIYAGHQAEGTAEMHRAAAMKPGLVDRELDKAAAYLSKGLESKAVLALHTALALDPACARAHYNLGLVYESSGRMSAAMSEYKQTLAIDPAYADAHNNLGIILAQTYRYDEALDHFKAAVRSNPTDADLRMNLARAYEAKGMAREAEAERALAKLADPKAGR